MKFTNVCSACGRLLRVFLLSTALFVFMLVPPIRAEALELKSLFQERPTSECDVAAWNYVYRSCRATSCGTEQYGHRSANRGATGGGLSCPFFTNAECAAIMQPGELLRSCEIDCNTKAKGFPIPEFYWEAVFKGTYYRVQNKVCSDPVCGVASRSPSTYTSCRSVTHPLDESATAAAMATGRGVDRAAATLARVISETVGISRDVTKYIENLVIQVTTDAAEAEALIDAVRKVVSEKGQAVTIDDVKQAEGTATQIIFPVVYIAPISSGNAAAIVSSSTSSAEATDKTSSTPSVRILPYVNYRQTHRPMQNGKKPMLSVWNSSKHETVAQAVGDFEPSGYAIGYGIDSLTGESKGACLVPKPSAMPTPSAAKSVNFTLTKAADYQSLVESLFGSASASVSAGLGNASASASFSKVFTSTQHSVFLIASVAVRFEEQVSGFADITPEWKAVLTSGDAGRKRFYKGCGDLYVRGEVQGSKFVALYKILAKSQSEKEKVLLSFSGSTATGSFKGSAEFARALDRIHNFTEVEVQILSLGYPGGTIPETADEIVEYAKAFPDKITINNAQVISSTTASYSDFPSYTLGNPFIDAKQKAFIGQADDDFRWLLASQTVLNMAEDRPAFFEFGGKTQADLLHSKKSLQQLMDALSSRAADCYDSSSKCNSYPTLDKSAIWIPAPLPKMIASGGCSGKSERFGVFNGGCLDTSTAITWSSVSKQFWSYGDAERYCETLVENQTKGWLLPSVFDLATISGKEGGTLGFTDGAALDDFFWAHDGATPKSQRRVNVLRGDSRANEPVASRYRVLCRQY